MRLDDEVDAPNKGSPISMQSGEADTWCTPTRGCTWVEKRKAWVLRYKDMGGVKRQNNFKADDCSSDSSKAEARANAISWLAEYKEGMRA